MLLRFRLTRPQELPGDDAKPFQRRNIFLLTMTSVTKYFFRVPAHRYFYVSSHRRMASWEAFPPNALFGATKIGWSKTMYRNTTVGSLPLGLSRRLLTQCCSLFVCLMLCCGMALWGGLALHAQSTAGGGIQGTITDPPAPSLTPKSPRPIPIPAWRQRERTRTTGSIR